MLHPTINDPSKNITNELANGRTHLPEPFPALEPPQPDQRLGVDWRLVLWGLFVTLSALALVAAYYSRGMVTSPASQQVATSQPRLVAPVSPTARATPSATSMATSTATATAEAGDFTFLGPTTTPTPVPGGRLLILTPAARDSGWVVSDDETIVTQYDPQNHFGDSFLYAGVFGGKIYHGAIQFDLGRIPRGAKIYAASLRLTGLRADQLSQITDISARWQLQLLAAEVDETWRSLNYQQIHQAAIWSTFEPPLTQEELGQGRINLFEFSPEQLALLERRIFEGSDQFGRWASFRLDGPTEGNDNLFAWDSGYGPASQRVRPELFLSLGPPPPATPLPYYVVITSTPTPQDVMTAAANSLKLTAEAEQFGTATPLPRHWVTPVVVTVTPTPQNQATAQAMYSLGTAIALTTGVPPHMVTATPSPTYVMITSTPTPQNVMTAVAEVLQVPATPLPRNWVTPMVVTATPTPPTQATAQAMSALATAYALTTGVPPNMITATPTPTYVIITSTPTPVDILTAVAELLPVTATPLPPNWVTPIIVTSTPTPANGATVEYLQAIILTTGTPTPMPGNVQTATPTPVFIAVEALALPTATATPTASPQPIPAALLGKILFLSDREGPTEEDRLRAEKKNATPEVLPQPYVFDPATGQLARLTDISPYQVATVRDSWSADRSYLAYSVGPPDKKKKVAIYYYDFQNQVEQPVTRMGAGIAYDAAWSPVKNELAFVSTESRNDEIWIIDSDGTDVRQLTQNVWEWDKHPSWSPDGQQIVFFSNRTGNNQLWIMNRDGSEQRLLMEWNPYNDWDPVWVKYLEPALPPTKPIPTPSVLTNTLTLLNPVTLDPPSYGPTNFEWRWEGEIPAGFGFEVRIWRDGQQPTGVHDAVLDNQNGSIINMGANQYRLTVDISKTGAVRFGNGDYLWTVVLVQISPTYADTGQQAPPVYFRYAGGH
jgi:hypothetical protein